MAEPTADLAPKWPTGKAFSPLLRWLLLLGILVHLAGFMLFRVSSNPLPSSEPKQPFVVFLSGSSMEEGAALEARASLFDSAPLFVPGRWSASTRVQPDFAASAVPGFPEYLPAISLVDELQPALELELEVAPVESPEDLLQLRFMRLLGTLGRRDAEPIPLEPWEPRARVRVLDASLQTALAPEAETLLPLPPALGPESLRPIILQCTIGSDGRLLSAPLLVQSSGNEAVDRAALDWVVSPAVLARLPAGLLELELFF
jgi:hypothetical protein